MSSNFLATEENRDVLLSLVNYATMTKRDSKCVFIDRFEEARSELSMNFDGGGEYIS
jgi:hypothetical protein